MLLAKNKQGPTYLTMQVMGRQHQTTIFLHLVIYRYSNTGGNEQCLHLSYIICKEQLFLYQVHLFLLYIKYILNVLLQMKGHAG